MIARIALLAAVVLVAAIVLTGGDDKYELQLRMPNAGGLKDGSPVTRGGVQIGKVDVDVDTKDDVAVAHLKIEDKYAPLGRDTSAQILAQNVLGQKQVQLATRGTDAPSRFVVPVKRITPATDLDRVLDVLDADTRARLAIFVNEAGTAFTGRRADFSRFLRDISPAVGNANELVSQLADDNAELGRLVATSDRYVATVTRRRKDVVRLVDRLGEAAITGSSKRAEIRRTLAEAPSSLRTLRGFLAELRRTTVPLRPAARRLVAASAPLRQTLDQIGPFTDAAAPALRTAQDVAPTLTRLATRATPVLQRATPMLRALRTTTRGELPAVFNMSDRALNNILAVVDNWSGAIQYRDGLSHVFRGEASISPDFLNSVVERLVEERERKARKQRADRAPAGKPAPKLPLLGGRERKPARPKLPKVELPGILKPVSDALNDRVVDPAEGLLDYLLGGK